MEKRITEMRINQAKLSIIQGDITKQATDAIVNAANPSLMGGGGVDGAIHRAGGSAILEECEQIVAWQGRLPTGKAVITTGGNLKARFVIHTVGPIWRGSNVISAWGGSSAKFVIHAPDPIWHEGNKREPELLASAYRESLKLAVENNLTSISFPSISTGAYGYPVDEAAKVAIITVASFIKVVGTSIKEVVFVLFDSATFESYSSVLGKIARKSKQV